MESHSKAADTPGSLQVEMCCSRTWSKGLRHLSHGGFCFLLPASVATQVPESPVPQHKPIRQAQELLPQMRPVPRCAPRPYF